MAKAENDAPMEYPTWLRVWDRVVSILRNMPLVGKAVSQPFPIWWKAGTSVFINLLFSTVPIWLGLIILRAANETQSLTSLYKLLVANGELYLLCTGLYGSIFFMLNRSNNDLGHRLAFTTIGSVVLLISGALFGVKRLGLPADNNLHYAHGLCLVTFVCFYLANLYDAGRDIPSDPLGNDESEYLNRPSEHNHGR